MLRVVLICAFGIGAAQAVEALIGPQAVNQAALPNAVSPTARDPRMFLEAAKQQLDSIPVAQSDKETRTRMATLRQDFTNLAALYQAGAAVDPDVKDGAARTATSGNPGSVWMSKFYDVERDLARILGLGPDFETPARAGTGVVIDKARPTAGTPTEATMTDPSANPANASSPSSASTPSAPSTRATSPSGAADRATSEKAGSAANPPAQPSSTAVSPVSGVAVMTIGLKNLDPVTRSQLEQLRTNVELFLDAATSLTNRR